ncbi:PulJ/GspJ family protein [Kineococcus sp. SYSU DK005]|uniref:PulJ/GspJ family protein n=1 Tax=Kineococcus sp. SYSU DK005 TaxID=3383126 RepID=UPI003D7DE56A
MRTWIRARGGATAGDEGLTLAETVVSMAIGSLLLALVGAFTVNQVRALDYADERATATTQMANAQDLVGKLARTMAIKTADPVGDVPLVTAGGARIAGPVAAGPETLGFYTYLNVPNPTQPPAAGALPEVREVWLWVRTTSTGARQLCEQTRLRARQATNTKQLAAVTPDLSNPANRTCHLLVDRLAPADAAQPLFTYLRASYDPLSGTPTAADVVANPVTADPDDFRALQVHLRVQGGTGNRPVVLESTSITQLMNKIGRRAGNAA